MWPGHHAAAFPCCTLQNPAGAQPPILPTWDGQPAEAASRALERLRREYEPVAAASSASEGEFDEEQWALGFKSDDEENGRYGHNMRRQVEAREARAQWGPQPAVTPQQLAAALAMAIGRGGLSLCASQGLHSSVARCS